MIEGIDDAVIMPVFNEEQTVGAVLDAVRGQYRRELIVVNDGSSDGTAEILAERDDILVVTNPANMGYGRSLIEGFLFAQFAGLRRVVTMDCDGQHEPAHIMEFFAAMGPEDDIISGSRYLPGSQETGQAAPEDRRRVNEQVTGAINDVTGWGITDAFCGFKAYRLEKVMAMGLSEQGYGMPMELWAKAHLAGLNVRELPVERIYCDHSRSFGDGLEEPDERLTYYMDVWDKALGGADG